MKKLAALPPLEAVQAWLDGSFGLGEESALIEAIRRDARITISDDDICEIMVTSMDEELDAATSLERLTHPE